MTKAFPLLLLQFLLSLVLTLPSSLFPFVPCDGYRAFRRGSRSKLTKF